MTLFLDWYNIIHVRHAYRMSAALALVVELVICILGLVGSIPIRFSKKIALAVYTYLIRSIPYASLAQLARARDL